MAFLDYSQLGLPLSTKDKNEVRYNCIYCDDAGYHLYVNIKKNVFNCFKCNTSGKTNVTVDLLKNAYFENINEAEEDSFELLKLPKPCDEILTGTATRYLKSRGLLESDVLRHKLYSAAPSTIYFGRIIIPSNPLRGYCNYYAARSYTKLAFPKYLNPSKHKTTLFESPKEQDKYFYQYWPETDVVLVEGPFDYLKTSRHGPTVCLLGKSLSHGLARRLVTCYSKAWVLLDRGLPEANAALKIQEQLNPFIDCDILKCPKDDPGNMNPEDFKELFR